MNVVMLAIALTTTVELSHTQARRSTSLPARFERFLAGAVERTSPISATVRSEIAS